MFQEDGLHTTVGDGADLGVIGWIQVKEREGFGPCNCVEGIALDGLDAVGAGYLEEGYRVSAEGIDNYGQSPAEGVE
jgi:hypothetical protein